MRLSLTLDPGIVRHWQIDLADRLTAAGHSVALRIGSRHQPIPRGLELLERFEETLYGRHRPLGGRLTHSRIMHALGPMNAPVDEEAAAIAIDLTSGDVTAGDLAVRGQRRLVLRAGRQSPEAGIAAALLDRRAPVIDLVLCDGQSDPVVVASGIPAVPDANVLVRAYETVAARLITLVELAVSAVERGGDQAMAEASRRPPAVSTAATGVFAVTSLAEKIVLRLKRMSRQADQWVVGWREISSDAVIDTLRWPSADYTWLPDDGLRYYADPFVFAHQGERYLFVEDYIYATGRGHLSVATWTGSGWSTPTPILQRPYHLSWPRVFRHDGQIYMLPETSAARTLELYRAVSFPYRWELQSVLLSDVALADATTITRADGTWILAAITDRPGASSWDGLAILRADDLVSQVHPTGPGAVLIDVRAARPAGDIVDRAGHWLRPVQDCSLSYGGALAIARVDALGPGHIRQSIVAHLPPPARWGAIGVHTLNAAAGLEVIDINRGFDIARRVAEP